MRTNLRSALLITLSYYVFWLIFVFITGNASLAYFAKGARMYAWQITFISFINIPLHFVAIPYVRAQKRRWLWGSLIFIAVPLCLIVGYRYWYNLGVFLSVLPVNDMPEKPLEFVMRNFVFQIFGLAYFASIKYYIDSFQMKLANQQLATEKKIAELSYLKSQTNPHFLFNTLNNIYLLTRDKSDQAPDSVLRLSGILRYMLYETASDRVPVDKEIEIIEDYLALEKIRYDASLQLKFTMEIDDMKQDVPPLLMLPLIENAFKHGVSEWVGASFIHISLLVREQTLLFTVENSSARDAGVAVKENIGIRNLRRQLELLFQHYELVAEARSHSFFVQMFINLESYAKN